MDYRPIGVFDSGLGGLTVVKELMACLPNENIIYFGDTARIPYGTRSSDAVTKYSMQSARFLLSRDIKMIVIACNTVSATSINILMDTFEIPIVGVIEPGSQAAALATKNERVGVIGTAGTIRSGAYTRALVSHNPSIKVFSTPCSLFVPLVEEGWSDTDIAFLTAQKYLGSMKEDRVDTLLLGCTHYPLLVNSISKVMGSDVTLVNPAQGTAKEVKRILEERDALGEGRHSSQYSFFVSDFGQQFKEIGSRFLGREIEWVEKIDIEKH